MKWVTYSQQAKGFTIVLGGLGTGGRTDTDSMGAVRQEGCNSGQPEAPWSHNCLGKR